MQRSPAGALELRVDFWPAAGRAAAPIIPIACFCTRSCDVGRFRLVRGRTRCDLSAMNRNATPDFRPRPGRIRDRGRPNARRSLSFVDQVIKAAAKANGGPLPPFRITRKRAARRRAPEGKVLADRGRGQAAAELVEAAGNGAAHRPRGASCPCVKRHRNEHSRTLADSGGLTYNAPRHIWSG